MAGRRAAYLEVTKRGMPGTKTTTNTPFRLASHCRNETEIATFDHLEIESYLYSFRERLAFDEPPQAIKKV